ncbi:MAG: 30S ribosomal protein S11 [Candidatus Parcubacteria bacterium]|nr:MAG: 30S ribosomal protein S11 [Candidatus Parcubacteria bacterium]
MGKKKVVSKVEESIPWEEKIGETAGKGGAVPSKKIENGRIYINATYNNTIITVTDKNGNVLAWASSGSLGFSGPKKATPFAASKVAAAVLEKVKKTGLANVEIIVKGVGSGRDSAIRTIAAQGINIVSLKDATPIPHNGPRPPKVRRV